MLREEKELFLNFIGDTKLIKWLLALFAISRFAFDSYFKITTRIQSKDLVEVYGISPMIESGGRSAPLLLIFKSTNKKLNYRVYSRYVSDKAYLLTFDEKGKRYKLKVERSELGQAQKGDNLNLYSINDEKSVLEKPKSYLTLQDFKLKKKKRYLSSLQVSLVCSSIFLFWILVLLFKSKKHRTKPTHHTAKVLHSRSGTKA